MSSGATTQAGSALPTAADEPSVAAALADATGGARGGSPDRRGAWLAEPAGVHAARNAAVPPGADQREDFAAGQDPTDRSVVVIELVERVERAFDGSVAGCVIEDSPGRGRPSRVHGRP